VTVQQLPRHAVEAWLIADQPCRTVRTVVIPSDRRSDAQPEADGDDDEQSNNQNKAVGTAVRPAEKEIGQKSGCDRRQEIGQAEKERSEVDRGEQFQGGRFQEIRGFTRPD
jgi:hypothetical protein